MWDGVVATHHGLLRGHSIRAVTALLFVFCGLLNEILGTVSVIIEEHVVTCIGSSGLLAILVLVVRVVFVAGLGLVDPILGKRAVHGHVSEVSLMALSLVHSGSHSFGTLDRIKV